MCITLLFLLPSESLNSSGKQTGVLINGALPFQEIDFKTSGRDVIGGRGILRRNNLGNSNIADGDETDRRNGAAKADDNVANIEVIRLITYIFCNYQRLTSLSSVLSLVCELHM